MRIKEMIANLKLVLTIKQILLVSTIRNVKRTVWRICILILGVRVNGKSQKSKSLLETFQRKTNFVKDEFQF